MLATLRRPWNWLAWTWLAVSVQGAASAQDVQAGSDLFVTLNDGLSTYQFKDVPADTFGTGSDFIAELVVPFRGVPLGNPGSNGADTIVERLQDAVLHGCPSTDTVDVQIKALSLQSTGAPFSITFNSGTASSTYRAQACLSSVQAQPLGSMTITRDRLKGGTFSSTLPVTLRVIFTRVGGTMGDPEVTLDPAGTIMLDVGTDPGTAGNWSYTNTSSNGQCFNVVTSPGGMVDHDCNDMTPDEAFAPSSNFYPGIEWVTGTFSSPVCTFGTNCAGASGSVPTLSVSASVMSGAAFDVVVQGKPICPAAIFFGTQALTTPLDLTMFGFPPGCGMFIAPLNHDLSFGPALTDATGKLTTTINAPAMLEGKQVFAQAFVFDQTAPFVTPYIFGSVSKAIEINFYDLLLPGKATDMCTAPCTPVYSPVKHNFVGHSHATSVIINTEQVGDPDDPDPPGEPQIGTMIITEFMADPVTASVPEKGDWIELYNATSVQQDVQGWTIEGSDGDFAVLEGDLGSLLIDPGGRFVLTQTTNAFLNGGVTTIAKAIDSDGNSFSLDPLKDDIILRDADGKLQDRLAYDTAAGWPMCSGASVSFAPAPPLQFAPENDVPTNWCCATATFCSLFIMPASAPCSPLGTGDSSTPSQLNEPCP